MGGRKNDSHADRFLVSKRGVWYYQRRMPLALREIDARPTLIRASLGTTDKAQARPRRDAYEAADNDLWGSLTAGDDQSKAKLRYDAAVKRAEAMGFGYRSAAEIAEMPLGDMVGRIEVLREKEPAAEVDIAVLGGAVAPPVLLSVVYLTYVEEIATDQLVSKSLGQRRKWKNVKKRAVDRFVAVVGDMAIGDIAREHALKFWRWWQARVAPKAGKPTHTPSSGNRELGSLRVIYAEYYAHLGDRDRVNPFDGLSFKEKAKSRRTRPPFPTEWIRDVLLRPGALRGLNGEARAILLSTIDTGARPSETANVPAEAIHIDGPVPYIEILERDDPEDPRELKSAPSIRKVPLVGVALEVFKAYPQGFPRYREREEAASAVINKYLRENKLVPGPKHTLYSLRHSFEDRMKEAGLTDDLRRILLGHKIDREEYGSGGALKWRQAELVKIVLPFDPAVVTEAAVRRAATDGTEPTP